MLHRCVTPWASQQRMIKCGQEPEPAFTLIPDPLVTVMPLESIVVPAVLIVLNLTGSDAFFKVHLLELLI